MMSLPSVFLLLLLLPPPSSSFVIAPPWADPASNPCAHKSWQLLLWPEDGRCYRIFGRGPCPRTQELAFDEAAGRALCRCPKDLLYWPATDRCYPEFSKGPCEPNQYLERADLPSNATALSTEVGAPSRCADVRRCENGWIFWPRHGRCYQLYTQGPCHKVTFKVPSKVPLMKN